MFCAYQALYVNAPRAKTVVPVALADDGFGLPCPMPEGRSFYAYTVVLKNSFINSLKSAKTKPFAIALQKVFLMIVSS